MAIYDQNKYYTCFSPRIKKNLANFGYFPEAEYEDIKTKKTCFVYKRDYTLNLYLGMTKYNSQNKLGYRECQIFKLIYENKLFPNTSIEDYDVRTVDE